MGDLDLPNRIVMAPLTRMRAGSQPLSASDVDLLHESATASGRKPTVAPRPMTIAEIRQTVADYARAARNAMEAGFDGLEILAAYLYLIPHFLNRTTNGRTDEYGVRSKTGLASCSKSSKRCSKRSIHRESA